MDWLELQRSLPGRSETGHFYIQILTSDRILRWPFSAKSDPPKYKTVKDAELIVEAYLRFTARNPGRCKVKRIKEEFLVVEITEQNT